MSTSMTEAEMSPRTRKQKRPLSIIEENDDDCLDITAQEAPEKENKPEKENTPEKENPDEEVVRSPYFKAIKQFFVEKSESNDNNNSPPMKKTRGKTKPTKSVSVSNKPRYMNPTKSRGPDPKLTQTSSITATTTTNTSTTTLLTCAITTTTITATETTTSTTTIPTTKTKRTTMSSPTPSVTTAAIKTSAAPRKVSHKAESVTKRLTTPTVRSPRSSPTIPISPKPESTKKPETYTRTSPTSTKPSSYSKPVTINRERTSKTPPKTVHGDKASRATPHASKPKVVKTSSEGKCKKNPSVKLNYKDDKKETTLSKLKLEDDHPSDVSSTDSLYSETQEKQIIINQKLITENAECSTNTSLENCSGNVMMEQSEHEPIHVMEKGVDSVTVNTASPSVSIYICEGFCSPEIHPDDISIGETIPHDSLSPSLINSPSIAVATIIKTQQQTACENSSETVPSYPGAVTKAANTKEINNNVSHFSEDQQNDEIKLEVINIPQSYKDTQNESKSPSTVSRLSESRLLQTPMSISLSTSPPSSILSSSPSSLSPVTHQALISPRSPLVIPKLKVSPTLTRRYSIDRNKHAKLFTNAALSPSYAGTHRNVSKECSPVDNTSEDGHENGFSFERSRLGSYSNLNDSPILTSVYRSARRGSYFFKRKQSTDSLNSLSEGEMLESCDDVSPISAADLSRLKETAERLHLKTRRASTMNWRQNNMDDCGVPRIAPSLNGFEPGNENLTKERKQKINNALEWLKNELQDMRTQDQTLARQLLTIRQDINQLKLQRCTEEHQNLLDDFKCELEELEEFSDVLDLPNPIYEDNPLKHIGITRHNIMSARRFSAC